MKKRAEIIVMLGLLIGLSVGQFSIPSAQTVTSFTKESDGALCQLSDGKKLKLQVCAGNIIRVVYTSQAAIPAPQGLVIGKTSFSPGTWDAKDDGTSIVVTASQVTATVTKSNGLISFSNSGGTQVCSEQERTLTAVTKGGQAGFSGTLNFNSPSGESIYGLGQLSMGSPGWGTGGSTYWESVPPDRNGVLDIKSFNVDLHQANWYDVIPFFITTSGYGVLMNFCCHATKAAPLKFTADYLLNKSWDYFFIYGPQFDTIISGYRNLTGPAPMLPKWAFGFWQCKNRYASSTELNTVVSTYRNNNIPLDCIVQDWSWWAGTTTGNGSFTWDAPYANPSNWISTLHTNNCRLALSIWPTFATGTVRYSEMQPYLLTTPCNGDATSPGRPMNIFDTTAARLFWGYMKTTCLDVGVDGWWMDAVEPECPLLTGENTSSGVIDQYANAYALAHAKNIYENQRKVSTKRVVNLTRSFWGGQQRFGTIYWNGDINSADIKNVATTVAGGLNSCMAGNPYWCSDIGGFMVNTGALTDEILARWFEAGTFFPLFRIHGSRETEIYNMSATVKPIAIAFTKLRYRLMPYIYSLAWKVTNEGYTMTRALPFDFPNDANVRNIANQYMFGPALLVCPITASGTSRNVYLPAGNWYDFWTGSVNTGTAGRALSNVPAPLQTIPIYVRAGSIIPMGPRIQYATQAADPIELRVYPGADGSFNLYEDEGDNYNYETGKNSIIPITYNNTTGMVTIGARIGSFPNMPQNHTFNVVIVKANHGIGDTVTTGPDCVISYSGSPVSGCPTSVNHIISASQKTITMKPALRTVDEPILFSMGKTKEVAVFNLSGKLIGKSLFQKMSVSLRKDFGLSNGAYIVKVKILQE
jgi:alpha-D-xyloside xylohydrolase